MSRELFDRIVRFFVGLREVRKRVEDPEVAGSRVVLELMVEGGNSPKPHQSLH